MMSGDDVLMMPGAPRIEVYTGTARRRRWSVEQKGQVVEDSYASSVGEAAARHGVSKSQLFNWRREARDGDRALKFARIELEGSDGSRGAVASGVIEIQIGAAAVRIPPGADPRLVATVLTALRPPR